jgi:hypothetical protein
MQKNIFILMSGILLAFVGVLGGFNLSYWLFYPAHRAEDASSVVVIAIVVASVILACLQKYRMLGFGMVMGCLCGIATLTLMLWGA